MIDRCGTLREDELVLARPDHARLERDVRRRDRRASRWSTSRSRGSARCGTSPTAPWPAARWRRTLVSEALGLGRRARDLAARRAARHRAWCSAGRSPTRSRRRSTWCRAARCRTGCLHVFDGLDGRRPAGRAGPRGHRARCAGWRSSTSGQQRRPQGRPRAGDDRRPPVRRRPRRHVPRREQAPHRAVGLGRRGPA